MDMWKNRRVLITGATGFIGSFLTETLLDAGAHVRCPIRSQNYRSLSERRAEIEWMEGDLRDAEFCAELTDGVDHVFHLASCRRNTEYHEKKCSDVLAENVRMSMSLIEGLRERNHIPVTFFSSANVPPSYDVLTLADQDSIDGYVLGKVLCEALWHTASRQHNFPLLIVRPLGVFGPRDTFNADANVIPALLTKARAAKGTMQVWGEGSEERSFLYVEDLIAAVLKLVGEGVEGVQYVTSPDVVTVRELATMIRDLVQPDLEIVFDASRQLGPRTIPSAPLHATIADFGWTPFSEGLRKTYESWR